MKHITVERIRAVRMIFRAGLVLKENPDIRAVHNLCNQLGQGKITGVENIDSGDVLHTIGFI